MEFFTGLVLVIVAFAAGVFAGKVIAPNAARIKALESKLENQDKDHQTYKDSVAEHFSKSANLFGDMTEKYRSLHEHLSTGATELCERRSVPRELSASHVNILAVETPDIAARFNPEDLNKSGRPSYSADDYMVDVTRSGFSHLDPKNQKLNQKNRTSKSNDNLPHQNQDDIKAETHGTKSAEIIDLESQRMEDAEQAKDYAIKEKGVINHNSLDRNERLDESNDAK